MDDRTTAAIETTRACRMGAQAAASTLLGLLLSGPVAVLVLTRIHPQPPWQSSELFARNFHPSQTFPYFAGFLLVGGYGMLMAALHSIAGDQHKTRTRAALLFTSAFVSLVFLNYVVQTTFIPHLASHYSQENGAIVAALSMANPTSLTWALEMWAWAFLGVATWLAAPVFSNGPLERATAWVFVANGVFSLLGAFLTAAKPGWVMTTAGLVGFGAWNALVFAMSALVLAALRRRMREPAAGPDGEVHGTAVAPSGHVWNEET